MNFVFASNVFVIVAALTPEALKQNKATKINPVNILDILLFITTLQSIQNIYIHKLQFRQNIAIFYVVLFNNYSVISEATVSVLA